MFPYGLVLMSLIRGIMHPYMLDDEAEVFRGNNYSLQMLFWSFRRLQSLILSQRLRMTMEYPTASTPPPGGNKEQGSSSSLLSSRRRPSQLSWQEEGEQELLQKLPSSNGDRRLSQHQVTNLRYPRNQPSAHPPPSASSISEQMALASLSSGPIPDALLRRSVAEQLAKAAAAVAAAATPPRGNSQDSGAFVRSSPSNRGTARFYSALRVPRTAPAPPSSSSSIQPPPTSLLFSSNTTTTTSPSEAAEAAAAGRTPPVPQAAPNRRRYSSSCGSSSSSSSSSTGSDEDDSSTPGWRHRLPALPPLDIPGTLQGEELPVVGLLPGFPTLEYESFDSTGSSDEDWELGGEELKPSKPSSHKSQIRW